MVDAQMAGCSVNIKSALLSAYALIAPPHENMPSNNPFLPLPIKQEIISYLDAQSIINLSKTCKTWAEAVKKYTYSASLKDLNLRIYDVNLSNKVEVALSENYTYKPLSLPMISTQSKNNIFMNQSTLFKPANNYIEPNEYLHEALHVLFLKLHEWHLDKSFTGSYNAKIASFVWRRFNGEKHDNYCQLKAVKELQNFYLSIQKTPIESTEEINSAKFLALFFACSFGYTNLINLIATYDKDLFNKNAADEIKKIKNLADITKISAELKNAPFDHDFLQLLKNESHTNSLPAIKIIVSYWLSKQAIKVFFNGNTTTDGLLYTALAFRAESLPLLEALATVNPNLFVQDIITNYSGLNALHWAILRNCKIPIIEKIITILREQKTNLNEHSRFGDHLLLLLAKTYASENERFVHPKTRIQENLVSIIANHTGLCTQLIKTAFMYKDKKQIDADNNFGKQNYHTRLLLRYNSPNDWESISDIKTYFGGIFKGPGPVVQGNIAYQYKILKQFLIEGADNEINEKINTEHQTIAHLACSENPLFVKLFWLFGADMQAQDASKKSPAHYLFEYSIIARLFQALLILNYPLKLLSDKKNESSPVTRLLAFNFWCAYYSCSWLDALISSADIFSEKPKK